MITKEIEHIALLSELPNTFDSSNIIWQLILLIFPIAFALGFMCGYLMESIRNKSNKSKKLNNKVDGRF